MTLYAVYDSGNGNDLKSVGSVLADPLPAGWVAKDLGTMDPPDGVWNPVTLSFDPVPLRRVILTRDFMQRLTQAERIDIRKSLDDIVQDLREVLLAGETVDLEDSEMDAGLDYLTVYAESVSNPGNKILAAGRKEQILA